MKFMKILAKVFLLQTSLICKVLCEWYPKTHLTRVYLDAGAGAVDENPAGIRRRFSGPDGD